MSNTTLTVCGLLLVALFAHMTVLIFVTRRTLGSAVFWKSAVCWKTPAVNWLLEQRPELFKKNVLQQIISPNDHETDMLR